MWSTYEFHPAESPTGTVIWLHGLGADGTDFLPLVPHFAVPRVRFVFPNAPLAPVTINAGHVMPSWYDIRSLATGDRPGRPPPSADSRPRALGSPGDHQGKSSASGPTSLDTSDPDREERAGVLRSAEGLRALIAREVARGIPESRIVLGGFSQGGAVAMYTALRFPRLLAGLVALSTYLVLEATLADEMSDAGRALPTFFGHGAQDEVVSLDRGLHACRVLAQHGVPTTWSEYRTGHSVVEAEIRAVGAFLRERLEG